jgi:hypothetical protein
MLTALALVLAAVSAAPAQQEPTGTIRGHVESGRTGLPIPLAVVEADDGHRNVLAMADSTGAYRLRVSAGRQTFRVRHLDHVPTVMDVLVPPGGEVELDVVLDLRPIALAPVRVRPPADPRADSIPVSRSEFNLLVVRRVTEDGGLGGALDPGFTPTTPEGGGPAGEALYVRGSSANLQLVLLDGAPVYAPFHMGGLIETFEPEVLGEAKLYLGGAPARYDGGLSYVMELSTRAGTGDGHTAAGSLDMVAATGRVEGPLPAGVRYLASARTVHGTSLTQLEGQPFPYEFADGLLRVDVPMGDGGLSVTAFANGEGVRVDTAGGMDRWARWGNLAGSARIRGRLEGADVEFTLAAGRFDAQLPLRDGARLFALDGRSERVRAGLDFSRPAGEATLRYGASFERTWVSHTARQPLTYQTLVKALTAGSAAGGYLDMEWQPNPRLLLRGGVRGDAFSVGGVVSVAPRGLATWMVSKDAALTLAAGRYHQYVRVPRPLPQGARLRNYADSARIPTHLAVGGATHLSLTLDQQLTAGTRLGLEGFYKRYDGLPLPQGVDSTTSTAHTSGMDVWVRGTAGRLTGWMGYSLGWAWSSSDGTGISSSFIGRQTLTAGARGAVWRHTDVGVRVAYGSGLPYTALSMSDRVLTGGSLPGPANGSSVDLDTDAPLTGPAPEPFLRLDAEVSRTWNARLAGRRMQITPYLRIINALESRDGLFYRYFDGDGDGSESMEAVATLPVVPVVGFNWEF